MYKVLITIFIVLQGFASDILLSQDYILKNPSRDGIGKFYQGREISKIMGHFGAAWLERQSRSREENPELAVDLLDLNKSLVVADFGAGTGYFTSQLAKQCSVCLLYTSDAADE